MPRYKLTIAYDGTNFCGWQKQHPPAGANASPGKLLDEAPPLTEPQPSPAHLLTSPAQDPARLTLRTVQEVTERAIREVVREPIIVLGASRTDAGVHARAQVAAFSCSDDPRAGWPADRGTLPLLRAINSRLPEDVLILAAEPTTEDFNPIAGATAKAYSYTLHLSAHRPLWDRHFVHHVWAPLDLDRMNEAAALLVGEHDFAAFAAAGHGRQTTVRTIFDCRTTEVPPHTPRSTLHTPHSTLIPPSPLPSERRLRIDISGNGFLWNMVRIIAGTLTEAGRGRISPAQVREALQTGDRRKAGPTLPPTGLCLEWIRYGPDA